MSAVVGLDWRPNGATESIRESLAVLAEADRRAAERGWPCRWNDRSRSLPLAAAGIPRQRLESPLSAVAPSDVYDRVPEPDRAGWRGVRCNLAAGERP